MNIIVICKEVTEGSGWSRFHLETVPSQDGGEHCPTTSIGLYVTNPDNLKAMTPGASYVMRFEEIGAEEAAAAPVVTPELLAHFGLSPVPNPASWPGGPIYDPLPAAPPPDSGWIEPAPEPSEDAGVVLGPVDGDEVALPVGTHPVVPPTEPT